MFCLSVRKNGAYVCNAGMADLKILTAHISGSRFDAAAGELAVTGMQDLPEQRSAHVTWVEDCLLKPGDSLLFILIDHDEPDPPVMVKPTDSAVCLQEQREYEALLEGHRGPEPLRPELRSALAVKFAVGDQEILMRLPEHHSHMLCTLFWDKWSPEHCKVLARSFPGAASGAVADCTEWLRTELRLGDSLEITMLA
jgi:hypothetical protein